MGKEKNVIILVMLLVFSFSFISADVSKWDYTAPENTSTFSVNYSNFAGDAHLFDGYSSTGYVSYLEDFFYPLSLNPAGYLKSSSLSNYYNTTQIDTRYSNNTGDQDLSGYALINNLVALIGNWTADKVNYYNKSEVYNKTEIDSKIPVYECAIRETSDLIKTTTPFDNYVAAASFSGTFATAIAQPYYLTNNASFENRNGVWAFRAHASTQGSGAYIRTGNKEISYPNETYIVRANVLFANVTGNETINGTNDIYVGSNLGFCVGQDTTTCGSNANKQGAWGLDKNPTQNSLNFYACYGDLGCYNKPLIKMVNLNLSNNVWYVFEAKFDTDYGFYINIWEQETETLVYNISLPYGTSEVPASLAAFPYHQTAKVQAYTYRINAFTTVSSPVFIDWIDYCVINDKKSEWGKIE